MKFTANVCEQKSIVRLGKINSVKLCPYIGKWVLVTIQVIDKDTKLPPITRQKPSAPQTISPG